MFRRIREYFTVLSDAQQAVNTILGVVAMVALGWAIIWKWISQLDWVQKLAIGIAAFCLLIIFIVAFITWWRKRDIEKIPQLLSQLDEIAQAYIRDFDTKTVNPQDIQAASLDFGEILKIDVWRFSTSLEHKDRMMIRKQAEDAQKKINAFIDPKNRNNDSLKLLLMMSGAMNTHSVGLDRVKMTYDYQKIYKKIKYLQRIVPSAETNIRINEYFNWSTGLYSLLLGYKYALDKPQLAELLPAEERATTTFITPQIEGNIATLISAVRESLEKHKYHESSK
jgi:hypothetical protein